MKYKLTLTLCLSFLFLSCDSKKKEKKSLDITNDFKIDVLNEILVYKLMPNISFTKKKDLISNYPLLPPPYISYYDSLNNNFKIERNYIKALSSVLKFNDTINLKNQIRNNKNFNLDELKVVGFNMLDVRSYYKNRVTQDSINKIVYEYYKNSYANDSIIPNKNYLIVSKPLFNNTLDKVYLRFSSGSSGYGYIFEKNNGKWEVLKEIENWVE